MQRHFLPDEGSLRSSEEISLLDCKLLTNVTRDKEPLRKGNFGVVYKGVRAATTVAMKKLITVSGKSNLKELETEAWMLNRLRDPFVVQFLGVCEWGTLNPRKIHLFRRRKVHVHRIREGWKLGELFETKYSVDRGNFNRNGSDCRTRNGILGFRASCT